MSETKTKYKSFANRLSIIVASSVLVVFSAIYLVNTYGALTDIHVKAEHATQARALYYSTKIEEEVKLVEMNVLAHEQALHLVLDNKDGIYQVLDDMMKDERLMYAFICLNPNQYVADKHGVMMEVVRKKDGSTYRNQRDTTYHFNTFPYYLGCVRLKRNYWTTPYYASGEKVSTFTHPLFDTEGNIFGVLGADMRLKILTEKLQEEISQDTDTSYALMVTSNDGHYVMHPNSEFVSNETMITDARTHKSAGLEAAAYDLIEMNDSTLTVNYDREQWIISYTPLPSIGWNVLIAIPYRTIYGRVFFAALSSLFVMLLCALLIIPMVRYIIRRKTKPIVDYAKSSKVIAQGNFDKPIQRITSGDEIQLLGDSLDDMRLALKDYVVKMAENTAARQTIERELSIAHVIQMSMLPSLYPSPIDHEHADVFAFLQPAKEVGGDLYDFAVKNDVLYFIVGDVSGKGIPASLVMAITSSVFRATEKEDSTPEGIVSNINNTTARQNERNMFVTLIVGELNFKTGKVRFCNAGHDPLMIIHNNVPQIVEMHKNLPVGLMEDFTYKPNEIDIQPGDKLLLYTDGVAEAENPKKELYTINRLIEAIERAGATSAKELIEFIRNDMHKFVDGADQSDDITILSIHYKPESVMKWDITFTNEISEVQRIAEQIEEIGEKIGFSFAKLQGVQLAVEEAVVNVINYAYPKGKSGTGALSIESTNGTTTFTLSDTGEPFDPTAKADPDITSNAEERPVGGLGIFLVKKIMKTVSYEWIDGKNVLTMTIDN